MRQGQQHNNKRPRGRGRKPQNVNRTFESNGPDVKIRGTAATVAEKYLSLARDAQVSGDPVASENYLQHAEHYFRVLNLNGQANPQANQSRPRPLDVDLRDDDEEGEDAAQGALVLGGNAGPLLAVLECEDGRPEGGEAGPAFDVLTVNACGELNCEDPHDAAHDNPGVWMGALAGRASEGAAAGGAGGCARWEQE